MFGTLSVPFGCVMLYNAVKLRDGVTVDDVELALGELCNVVKNTYGNDNGGFIGGQVYRFGGFVSDEGSIASKKQTEDHIAIVTYWQSFEQLADFASETYEIGYEMLWQGKQKTDIRGDHPPRLLVVCVDTASTGRFNGAFRQVVWITT